MLTAKVSKRFKHPTRNRIINLTKAWPASDKGLFLIGPSTEGTLLSLVPSILLRIFLRHTCPPHVF